MRKGKHRRPTSRPLYPTGTVFWNGHTFDRVTGSNTVMWVVRPKPPSFW